MFWDLREVSESAIVPNSKWSAYAQLQNSTQGLLNKRCPYTEIETFSLEITAPKSKMAKNMGVTAGTS